MKLREFRTNRWFLRWAVSIRHLNRYVKPEIDAMLEARRWRRSDDIID